MIIQFCGLSGSGKTTLAKNVKRLLLLKDLKMEIIDGDEYREALWPDLGFSLADRNTNIRRLAYIASKFSFQNVIPIICAINPYENIRREIIRNYSNVKTVFIDCDLKELIRRDTKGLYKRAFLPDDDPQKLRFLTGVSDPFEAPQGADLIIKTDVDTLEISTQRLMNYILKELKYEDSSSVAVNPVYRKSEEN